MADRYWVGGSGTWDSSSTANWSATSGGAAGASAPTDSDNAYFDGASDSGAPFTVTISGEVSCANLIVGDGTTVSALDAAMTLAGTSVTVNVYGSLYFPATNLTRTATGAVIFQSAAGSHTITTNGVSLAATASGNSAVLVGPSDWSTATYTLGSALTIATGSMQLRSGTFDTANNNVTVSSSFIFNSVNAKTLTLGASTLAIGIVNNAFPFTEGADTTNTTINAGTSTITFNGSSTRINDGLTSGGFTFYNVRFLSQSAGTTTINGANTFNNFEQRSLSATGVRSLVFNNNQTVNGILTLGHANTAIRRVFARSNVIGASTTITLNGSLATLANVDFRDITAAGTVGTWTGTRIGNCLGNSGITFDAAKTVYRVGTGNWSATQWSTSSGGSLSVNNFPLAQDTMIFDANTVTGTHTIDQGWQLGTLDCSALTVSATIASGTQAPIFYKNIVLDADVTLTGTGVFTFSGQGTTQSITSAGISFTQPLTINSPSGTVKFLDALSVSNTLTITDGTVELASGATSTVTTFVANSATQKFLNATTPGTQATLSQTSGTVDVSNLTITDSAVTGGAIWNAYVNQGNIDAGNNDGWDFGLSPDVGAYEYTYRLRSFTQPKRF